MDDERPVVRIIPLTIPDLNYLKSIGEKHIQRQQYGVLYCTVYLYTKAIKRICF